jgi:hypothetical protein
LNERITIDFVGGEVGIQYYPESAEASMQDEMLARELALTALADQAIQLRQRNGLPVPETLLAIAQAHTFNDLI